MFLRDHVLTAQFLRFVLVGLFNTAAGFGLYLLLLWLGLGYLSAYALALVIMLVTGFVTTGHIVFGHLNPVRFWLYVLFWAILFVCNLLLLHMLVWAGAAEEIAPILLLPVNAMASYFLQKLVVFRPPREALQSGRDTHATS